jgi:hypothetical protein
MRIVLAGLLLSTAWLSTGAADDPLKESLQEKFQIAEIFEAAAFASEKCPGLHVVEDGVNATSADLGFSYEDDDVIHSPAFKLWESCGQVNARIGYGKDPLRHRSPQTLRRRRKLPRAPEQQPL